MVQYSDPARPAMTRRTLSCPLQSGQQERTEAGELADVDAEDLDAEDLASESYMGGFPLWFDVHASLVEIVDPGLRIRDRRIGIGPGETDFQLGKRNTVDDDRLEIRPPDPGVPEAFSGLEGLDLKAVIVHVASPANFQCRRKT
ncbi:MAG: hypothetical protein ACLQDM_10760 [Bradyrhizobium sp.]